MDANIQKILEFVKKNILILTTETYDKEKIKLLRKQFFIDQYKGLYGKPSEADIARGVILVLKKSGKLNSAAQAKELTYQIPFLSKNLRNLEKYDSIFEDTLQKSSILTIDDLSKIDQTEYLIKKELEMQNRIIEEKSKDIENAIEQKRLEYDSYPSVLDSRDFEEPLEMKDEHEAEVKEWWQILGLSSDPFPRQEGLDRIPENIYEKVIYKNDLIQEYIKKIESNRDKILNKGILLLGRFGTGKTTFFDYLSYHLTRNKICALRMTFNPKADVFTYASEFETKLYTLLKSIYSGQHGDFTNGPPVYDNSKKIMLALKDEGWSFMVIMDDLHKHLGNEDIVLKFLSSLQIVKDDFIRSGINIGFLIAGIPSWELKMKEDGSLPGFFDTTPEIIPEITAEAAYNVINNRLRAYSINTKRRNIIDLSWIRQIHRKISQDGYFVNYRILINSVISELENKNFNILTLYLTLRIKIFNKFQKVRLNFNYH